MMSDGALTMLDAYLVRRRHLLHLQRTDPHFKTMYGIDSLYWTGYLVDRILDNIGISEIIKHLDKLSQDENTGAQ